MRILFVIVIVLTFTKSINGQVLTLTDSIPQFNITENNDPDDGYLFMTTRATTSKAPAGLVIADNYGTPIFYQYLPDASGGFALQRNGLLSYRTNSSGSGRFYVMDSSYTIIDSVWMEVYELDGHDFIALENGNYIIFGLDLRSTDLTQYGGEIDATVEGCVIQELDKDKNVLWEWNSWDHFDIEDTYKDLTTSVIDMVHPNSLEIDYDDNILLISRAMNEVTKISRTTGDMIWRLGGKNNQFTFGDSSQMFSLPHDFRLLENGNYTIFDNGSERDPSYSRAIEYHIDEDNMTCDMVWEYDANKEIFGPSGGSARRLPNGNTILGYGGKASWPATIEVHPDGSKALQLDFVEKMSSGRITKAPWKSNLFEPSTYSINFGEWDGYTTSDYLLTLKNNSDQVTTITGYSTRTDAFVIDETFPLAIPAKGDIVITVSYYPSTINHGYIPDVLTIDSDIVSDTLVRRVSQQIILKGTKEDNVSPTLTFNEDGTEEFDIHKSLSLTFSEPVRMLNDELFTYSTIDQLITLKEDDENGADVPFNATLNSDKTEMVVIPDDSLKIDQNYYLMVSAEFEDFTNNPGSQISGNFTTGLFNSKREEIRSSIHLYPNPGTGIFHLRFTEADDYSLELLDMTGRIVYSTRLDKVANYTLNLSSLTSGLYFLKAIGANPKNTCNIRLIKK